MHRDVGRFQLYKLLKDFNNAGAKHLRDAFKQGLNGDDEARYQLAARLQTLCSTPNIEAGIPGLTESIKLDTMRQSFEILRDLAEKNHANATLMLASCYIQGLGCAPDYEQARIWQKKAESMAETAQNPVTRELGNKLDGIENVASFSNRRGGIHGPFKA